MKIIIILFLLYSNLLAQTNMMSIQPSDQTTKYKPYSTICFNANDTTKLSKRKANFNNSPFLNAAVYGILGGLAGYTLKRECNEIGGFQICDTKRRYVYIGATIGSISGTLLGYIGKDQTKSCKYRWPRIVLGSIAGGAVGYWLAEYSHGIGTLVLPPLSAHLAIKL